MLITGAVVEDKERVPPGCLSPGASLRVVGVLKERLGDDDGL